MIEKIGPYRVYERLGVGGMGEVYKAYDDRLDRWVAIKRIRPDREDADDNRERFKREARATARLNHPSIVHLYGIFQDGDSDCIVMEYVEGQTLDKILADGPIDSLRTATLGHEIAAGLAEAHANGILHRDLKAENIIITPRGRAKILDFGLAKPILRNELDPVLTGKGQLVGTSRAMSPEYVGGEEIDHRSDLFSLGVLLYECVTGQSPFKAHNTLATLKQVMLHKQTPIRELNPGVPAELAQLIDQLLEKEPDDRPQTAQEVSLALGRLTGQMSSGILDRPSTSDLSPVKSTDGTVAPFSASDTVLDLRPPRRLATVLVILAVLLAGAFLLGRYLSDDHVEVPPLPEGEPIRVVLADFANQTNETVFDDSLGQALRVGIEQSRLVSAVSPSQVREALGRMKLPFDTPIDRNAAIELAKREGIQRVIIGRISKFGPSYSLLVEVVAPVSDTTTFSASESADSHEDILSAVGQLSKAVRLHLGESADKIADETAPLEKVTTSNFEALRAYSVGVQKLLSVTQAGPEDQMKALLAAESLLTRALQLDPEFAMADAKLVAVYSNLGLAEKAQAHAEHALANADRLTEAERFYIDGWVARWRKSPSEVIDIWSLMSDLHPDSFAAHYNLGSALWIYENDFPRVRTAFENAARVATGAERRRALWCLAYAKLALGETEGVPGLFEQSGPTGTRGLASFYISQGRLDSLPDLVQQLGSDPSDQVRLLALADLDAGVLMSAFERYSDAYKYSLSGEHLAQADALMSSIVGRATTASRLRDGPALDRALEDGVDFAVSTGSLFSRTDSDSSTLLAILGRFAARSAGVAQAERIRGVIGSPPDYARPISLALILSFEAEIELARNNPSKAVALAEDSIAQVETILGHETLARALVAKGELNLAVKHYQWIVDHRGLAFVECTLACPGPAAQVDSWNLAHYHLGRIMSLQNETQDAHQYYRNFLVNWDPSGGSVEAAEIAEVLTQESP